MTDRIIVGTLSGAYGVHGEVRLKSYCAEPEAIVDYTPLYTTDGRQFAQIVLTGRTKNALTARVDGIVTKEDADALKGVDLYAERGALPSLPDDEYYYSDLVGLTVMDTGGQVLGIVKSVMNHGASDLLEVMPEGGGDTVLLPFTQTAVPTVDLGAGRIVADPPDGVFPDG